VSCVKVEWRSGESKSKCCWYASELSKEVVTEVKWSVLVWAYIWQASIVEFRHRGTAVGQRRHLFLSPCVEEATSHHSRCVQWCILLQGVNTPLKLPLHLDDARFMIMPCLNTSWMWPYMFANNRTRLYINQMLQSVGFKREIKSKFCTFKAHYFLIIVWYMISVA